MTHETATPEKKALLEAFDHVLKTQAEEREALRRLEAEQRLARARSRPVMWICAAILLFVSAYLYVEQPEWVFPSRGVPESVEIQEASLRIEMANTAQHIERYRQRNGRAPATLAEAGAHGEGLTYRRVAEQAWELSGRNGAARLTLTSTEPLAKFLGNSFQVVARRPQ